ncbi:MAG: hypothetical protein RI933_125 [Actinomycetota bacterium]|uniref:Potassium ABC transporter n=1 Tax=Candidatus Rhodoluna planktonica TaxID=535712 RepID=A0A1D9DZ18_9MICO|nr:DUF3159 domain-containing protein [Candidatus Rhodoluna planktonica]AOY56020.1 hypothetical protein A4Z71_03320 [Candidatus Rhodoluna planktonica]
MSSNRLGIEVSENGIGFSKKSLLSSLGGWLGIAEVVLPATTYTISVIVTKDVLTSVILAATLAVAFLLLQLFRRKPITQSIAGFIGIAISAALPLREGGQAVDYFIQGFFTNAIYLVVLVISVLIRWPLVGLLVGAIQGDLNFFRASKAQLRRYTLITLMWIGLFSLRLIVQLPLFFSNQVEALGAARILMGVPLYALLLWFTWLSIRNTLKPVS